MQLAGAWQNLADAAPESGSVVIAPASFDGDAPAADNTDIPRPELPNFVKRLAPAL